MIERDIWQEMIEALSEVKGKIEGINPTRTDHHRKLLKLLFYSRSLEPGYKDLWEALELVGLEGEKKMAERLLNRKQVSFGDLSKVDINELTEEMGV